MESLWLIDVSVGALLSDARMYSLLLENIDPMKTYHAGLIANIMIAILLICYFYLRTQTKPNNNGTKIKMT
jgi:hypothetical protein